VPAAAALAGCRLRDLHPDKTPLCRAGFFGLDDEDAGRQRVMKVVNFGCVSALRAVSRKGLSARRPLLRRPGVLGWRSVIMR